MSSINELISKIISDENISLLINNIKICEFIENYEFGPHSHNSVEVNFVKKGSCYIKVGNEYVRFKKNDCMIIYPKVSHYFCVKDRRNCVLVQLDFKIDNFPELCSDIHMEEYLIFIFDIMTNSRQFIKIRDNIRISSCMERILDEIKNKSQNHEILIRLIFCELFIVLSREIDALVKGVGNFKNKYMKCAIKIINDNYEKKTDINQISKRCGISERYLRKIFKKQIGMTITDYITALRIRKAKQLIQDLSYNMTEIAQTIGFTTQQYFCKVFKQNVGMTPMEYRNDMFRKI